MGRYYHRNPDPAGSGFTSRDLKAKVVRLGHGRQVDGGSTGFLDCFPSKWADSISAFPTDSQTRPPPAPIRGGESERIRT